MSRQRTSIFLAVATAMFCLSSNAFAQDEDGVQENPLPDDTSALSTTPVVSETPEHETVCDDRIDDDGDGVVDCADADCFLNAQCDNRTGDESTAERCSDWIDNDGDGAIDCDDGSCAGVAWCQGSLGGPAHATAGDEPFRLEAGQSTTDFVGAQGDLGGERNDFQCSDGIDNDGDGRIDCQDFGCRYDPSVRVCQGPSNYRFSVVAGIGGAWNVQSTIDGVDVGQSFDVNFTRLQLRVLGTIPYIQDSFFLLSMRMEKSPRLTFANFQVPVGNHGMILGINSGGATLSTGLVISAAKNPLLDPAYYMFNAFEQGNGAAMELNGSFDDRARFRYRLFAAGGSGEFNGNVGGRFFRSEDRNVTWGAGAAVQYNAIGFFDRFDSRLAYLEMPLTLSFSIGAKYAQRSNERYPAANFLGVFEYGRFLFQVESNFKYDLDFESFQMGYNALAEVILVPRKLVLAVDGGQFIASDYNNPPTSSSGPTQPLDVAQWRAALHYFWFQDRGLATLLYTERHTDANPDRPEDPTVERELRVELQYRF